MADDVPTLVGSLSMRTDGQWWIARWVSETDGEEHVIEIARMLAVVAQDDDALREAFVDLARGIIARAIRNVGGNAPTWGEPEPGRKRRP